MFKTKQNNKQQTNEHANKQNKTKQKQNKNKKQKQKKTKNKTNKQTNKRNDYTIRLVMKQLQVYRVFIQEYLNLPDDVL